MGEGSEETLPLGLMDFLPANQKSMLQKFYCFPNSNIYNVSNIKLHFHKQ